MSRSSEGVSPKREFAEGQCSCLSSSCLGERSSPERDLFA